MKRKLTTLAIAVILALASREAHAQAAPDTLHAKEAYDRGVAAHERGDFPRAAREFATADSLAPSPVALQAALDAAVDADDPVIGGELLERSKRLAAPLNPKLAQSIDAARKKLGGRAGRVHVTCPAGVTCTATLDGKSFDPKNPAWVVTGPHNVVVQLDGDSQSKAVDVKADELVEIAPARKAAVPALPPAPLPPPAATAPASHEPAAQALPAKHETPAPDGASSSAGLPRVVFFIGAGATLLAGGAATYFMVSTRAKHEDFVSGGCETGPAAGCDALKKEGESAQTTANIALGVTAVLAVATVVIGVAFTDWNPRRNYVQRLLPRTLADGGGASYSLRF